MPPYVLKGLVVFLLSQMVLSLDIELHKNYHLIDHGDICGLSSADRIFGGEEAYLGQFPWMARVGYRNRGGITYYAAGSIITKHFILTATHVHKENAGLVPVVVAVGDHYDTTDPDCQHGVCAPPVQVIPIAKFIRHEDYHVTGDPHDIALILLTTPIQFNDYVQPICLPVGTTADLNLTGEVAEGAGWGTFDSSNTMSKTLKKVKLRIWPHEKCKKAMLPEGVKITEDEICAGGVAGEDTCTGDSGGPLMKAAVQDGLPRYYVVGIVSFGHSECGKQDFAGVYILVHTHVVWILDHLTV